MASTQTSVHSFALSMFLGQLEDVMTEKDLQLVTEDGDEVKMDLLFRMMHENLQESHEWMKSDVPTPTYSKPARSTTTTLREDQGKPKFARKIAKNTVKIPFKDVKKVMGAKEDPKKPEKVFWPFKGISLPFLPNMIDYECQGTCCQALKVQGNLFVPCGTNVPVDRELGDDAVDYGFPVCSTCRNQSGVEKYGSLSDRLAQYENGDFYTAPKVPEDLRNLKEGDDEKKSRNIDQKKEISFGTFMAKRGDLGTDAKQRPALLQEKIDEISEFFAEQFGLPLDLPEHQLLIDGGKVRAKKQKSSSDDESSVSSAESGKKKVKKSKKAAAEVSVESPAAEVSVEKAAAEVSVEPDDDVSVSSESSAKSQKAQKKAEEKAKKLAEKEAKAQKKAEEKAKKLAEKEAKKQEKEAKKLEKAQKKAEKEAKKQEKGKKRSASIDSTDSGPSENVPQETVEKKKAVEKAVEPEEEDEEIEDLEGVSSETVSSEKELQAEETDESDDESDDDEAEYKNFKYKGVSYWIDEENVVFSDNDGEPGEYVGDLNKEGKIEFKEE